MAINSLLNGKYDEEDAIISIHAGSGGRDAMEWTEMLLRMYLRWAAKMNFDTEVLDEQRDVEYGMKSAVIKLKGDYAYGYAKSEKGVHRLVRISPFDTAGRRHTSFAAVDVIPDFDTEIELDINTNDLKIDTYRASGAGGQHVNKTDSAVRITHIPSSIVVQCQSGRSQIKNKEEAMKMLRTRLMLLKEQEQKEKIEDIQGDFSQISWGSQIRSYVFHPYKIVKDHRTNAETGNLKDVMDGNLDLFVKSYLSIS